MDDNLHNPEQDQDHLDINKLLDERLRIDRLIDRRCKKNITIIFRDIVGSTKYFEIDGDVEGRTMIQKHNNLLFPIIESFNGQIIKTISDSIMAKFDSANEALEASISIQKALWSYNEEFKRKRDSIRVRIGAHSGTAVETSGDYYGDMINTAARIESKAGMDEILVSGDKVHNLSEDKKTKCVFIMSEKLSGKAVEIDIYAVNWKDLDKNAFMDSLSSILLDKKGKKSLSKKSPTNKVTDGRQGVYLLEKFKLPPRRHIKKKTQRGNPYLNRIMIMNPTDYFGRKLIIRKIFSKIDSARSQSISIIGDRKIGKSSLLNYLMQPETRRKYLSDPDSYVFVYLDFQQFRRNTMEDFFRTVFNGLIREFMGNISINVEPDFRGLLEVVEEFERNNLNLIFLFDEFEVITKNKHFTLEFFSCFRSIA
ncbi:adenylate/guanylate cyclase domain-containing protein, partial [bacterium]|nr:adenylate/guanylate cyclase domain-containing protein [bacterium]